MKIVIYTLSFAPLIGGEETHLQALVQGVAARLAARSPQAGSLTLVTPTPGDGFDDATLPCRVVRRPSLGTLWRLLGEADVVHLSGPVLALLLLAWLRGKKVVVRHHVFNAACPNGLLFYAPERCVCPGHFLAGRYAACLRCNAGRHGWLWSAVMLLATFPRRWLCRSVAQNLAVTDYVAQRVELPGMRTLYPGIPDVPAPARNPGNQTQVVRPRSSPFCFGYVGRLVPEKGVAVLFEAAQILRETGCDFRLKLVGDGPARPELEAQVASRGLAGRVAFTGFLRAEALRRELEDVQALVMPSLCAETGGNAAIEQMMRGGLVIASDLAGLAEVVGDAGLKFAPGNAAALAECMRRAMEQPEFTAELSARARQRALRLFRQERMVAECLHIYEQVAKGNPAASPGAG